MTKKTNYLSVFSKLKYERSSYFDQYREVKYGEWIDRHWVKDKTCTKKSYYYNTTAEGLMPTPVTGKGEHNKFCCFCGHKANTIQGAIRLYQDYSTTGHFCDCVYAEQWLKSRDAISEMEHKHQLEMRALKNTLPKENETIKEMANLDYTALRHLLEVI
jgi:hypothetical protein